MINKLIGLNKYKSVYRFKTVDAVMKNQNKGLGQLFKTHDWKNKKSLLVDDQLGNLKLLETLPVSDNIQNIKEFNLAENIRGFLPRMLPDLTKQSKIGLFYTHGDDKVNKAFVSVFNTKKSLTDNISALSRLQPDIIIAPPSMLRKLSQAIYNKRLTLNLTNVIAFGQQLEDKDKEYFIKQFKVEVIHQLYTCKAGILGYTCHEGTLHINEDLFFMEKEEIDETRFYPIITDISQKNNSVVRYRLEDILVRKKEDCSCGCQFLGIEKIEGKAADVIRANNENGHEIHIFPSEIYESLLAVDGVRNYKMRQVNDQTLQIKINYDQSNLFVLSQSKVIEQEVSEAIKKICFKYNISEFEIVYSEYS